ncbi:MAG: hypothetical protein PWQ43_694 [Rikenellaceae bacterium]|nr:hypothetical protein [Rikenellaceae bacterium]MDN5355752.1 hypothetical protein [Rikenellaceae bacterium]
MKRFILKHIKKYVKYLGLVTSIMFLLIGCVKEQGPFNTDVKIITDVNFYIINITDTCKYNELKMGFNFNGILVLEDGPPYEMWDYYTEMPDGYYFKNIKIYTYYKYNENYDKGEDISDIVEIEYWRGLTINIGSISDYDDLLFEDMHLILSQPPSNNGTQRFIVEIDNGAGEIYRDTTRNIYLTNE